MNKQLLIGFQTYLIPTVVIIVSIIIGWFVEKYTIARFKKLADKTESIIDDILVHSFHNLIIFWFGAVGIYISLHQFPFPEKTQEILVKLFWSVIIFSFTLFTARLLVELTKIYTSKVSGLSGSVSVFTNIIRIVVFSIGIMIILQHFGISITPIITALGVGGLAVALALQDTLSNFFAGIQILVSKQVRPGDFVRIDPANEGVIKDITWRNTLVETPQGNVIVVPNSKFSQSMIVNMHLPEKKLLIRVEGSVSYNSDLEYVENVLIEIGKKILQENEGGIKDFEPVVRFYSFGDSAILFRLILACESYEYQFALIHKTIKLIHKTFNEKGIEIPFPQRVVHLQKNIGQ
ncbi:MAG: mechanosensitive ion channel protein [Bacteroidia bacterium]|nr:MAG: mechanosensitive ion channel protein [Bacteroidia bacterium]